MEPEPDMRFDVDALFDHLVNNLEYDLQDEHDWNFELRAKDIDALQQVAGELEDEFVLRLQENVQVIDIDGNVSLGDPMLTISQRGALTADEVKQTAARIQKIATDRGLTYEGVNCYEPFDEDEIYGWLAPDDAGWRLRHMSDCGLEEDAELPWAFLVEAPSLEAAQTIATELSKAGYGDRDIYDEPDETGNFGLCVFVEGRNNEIELNETAGKIAQAAESHGGGLVGIQFYTREDVAEVFGDSDEA